MALEKEVGRKKVNYANVLMTIVLLGLIFMSLLFHEWKVAIWQAVLLFSQVMLFTREKQLEAYMVLSDRTTELLQKLLKNRDELQSERDKLKNELESQRVAQKKRV